jgi:hypothetical protein
MGVGLIGGTNNQNPLAADLHMIMGGSLPQGSHVETLTDQQQGSSLGHVIGQSIHHAVQENHKEASYTWEFDFNTGSDNDPGKVHFGLSFGHGGLGTLGSANQAPIQAFDYLFGNSSLDGKDPNITNKGGGVYEVHVNGLGTFLINLGVNYPSAGNHHATMKFSPDPGVDLPSGLKGLELTVFDGDQDLAQSSFNLLIYQPIQLKIFRPLP